MTHLTQTWQDYPAVAGDRLLVLRDVASPQLGNRRDLFVLLPPSYTGSARRYPVLYFHDAQNLFDPALSFAGETWQVDATMQALSREGLEALVVGISHAGVERIHELNPWARGEAYLSFLVDELKPMVDAGFRTLPDRTHTGIVGSSLGGLISLYAVLRRTGVFGMAGVMSPALWVNHFAILNTIRESPRVGGRLYLDHGTREGSARPAFDALLQSGYHEGAGLRFVKEEDGMHRESAWARRLPGALRFLLGGS